MHIIARNLYENPYYRIILEYFTLVFREWAENRYNNRYINKANYIIIWLHPNEIYENLQGQDILEINSKASNLAPKAF